jgi:uncharacterized protein (DUF2252 family)
MANKLKAPRQILAQSKALRERTVWRSGVGGARNVRLDFRSPGAHWEHRHEGGKALRERVPRERFADWEPPKDRPDPVELVAETNKGRLADLVPLRWGRMAASPFGFLRGATAVMGWDLAHTSVTGIEVLIDGDAHLGNFGLYGTPQRDIVFDLNDFDEATIGPWEWDLRRLCASINVLGRENGLNRSERFAAVKRAVAGYRASARRLESTGILDTWYVHSYPGRENPLSNPGPKSQAIMSKLIDKASRQTNATLLRKVGERTISGAWRFREDPPILTRVDDTTREAIIDGLADYTDSLSREMRYLVSRYHVVDVARRVVGVGSVGTRAYLALLFGNDDNDPLFLQVKEAVPPAAARFLPELPEEFRHDGWRVVIAQAVLQASSDLLLGWTTINGRAYYVRQMKNMKGSIPYELLSGEPYDFYAWACGVVLARAHGRQGAGASIAGYCGGSEVLDVALAHWAERYGDQTIRDHAALLRAIKAGRIEATMGV